MLPFAETQYLSAQSQNEMIDVIGKKIIQAEIINEIKAAGFHAISADEVTCSNDEILSVCFRYVDSNRDIKECFLDFIELERISGDHIGRKILDFYDRSGIDPKQCRGQCYDGAANMQSENVGVVSRILKVSPNAIATHCCSHNLNLCLAYSCKIQLIQNVLDKYKDITIHFNISPKKENLFQHVVDRCVNETRKKVLIGLCKTR